MIGYLLSFSVFKYAPTADERSGKFDGGGVNGQVVNTQFVFRLDYKDWMVRYITNFNL